MAPVLDELEKNYAGKFVVERIDTDKEPAKAKEQNIQSIPTLIFLSPDGKVLFRMEGGLSAQDVAAKWAELGYKVT
jgi:thioredoxin 1